MSLWDRISKGKVAVAVATASLLLPASVVIAAPQSGQGKRPPAVSVTFDRGFTPSQADPRLVAAFANRPVLASDFKFTPSASKRRPSQIRVAIRARASTPAEAAARVREVAAQSSAAGVSLTPASYNLGVAVGWRRLAISGDVARSRDPNPVVGDREGAVVGVSYNLKRFTGRVAASADRPAGRQASALDDRTNYALDVGGSFNISRNIAVTGGVRYKIERERLATLNDERRDSQSVYIGTALKF